MSKGNYSKTGYRSGRTSLKRRWRGLCSNKEGRHSHCSGSEDATTENRSRRHATFAAQEREQKPARQAQAPPNHQQPGCHPFRAIGSARVCSFCTSAPAALSSHGEKEWKGRARTHAKTRGEFASWPRGMGSLRSFAQVASQRQGRDHACRPPLASSIGDSLWFRLTFCSQSCTPPVLLHAEPCPVVPHARAKPVLLTTSKSISSS